ncbi:MAG: lipoate--protein ligase family protein [Eubacteriales bacterium]|nr:lipoate--protein ligase family protein [Eubacteriales bacterium]
MNRAIFLNSKDTARNLATEAYFYEEALGSDEALALLYVDSPSLVFGRSQNPYRELDWLAAAERQIPMYRRISGGGAVYHDLGNLNYCFIVPRNPELVLNYAYFLEPLSNYLEKLGLQTEILRKSNLYLRGKKISGNAMALGRDKILAHGTVLFNSEIEPIEALLHRTTEGLSVTTVASDIAEVQTISELLPELSFSDFCSGLGAEIIGNGLRDYDFTASGLWPEEELAIERDYVPRFKSFEWNFKRGPEFSLKRENASWLAQLKVKGAEIIEISFEPVACDLDLGRIAQALEGRRLERAELLAALSFLGDARAADFLKELFA